MRHSVVWTTNLVMPGDEIWHIRPSHKNSNMFFFLKNTWIVCIAIKIKQDFNPGLTIYLHNSFCCWASCICQNKTILFWWSRLFHPRIIWLYQSAIRTEQHLYLTIPRGRDKLRPWLRPFFFCSHFQTVDWLSVNMKPSFGNSSFFFPRQNRRLSAVNSREQCSQLNIVKQNGAPHPNIK